MAPHMIVKRNQRKGKVFSTGAVHMRRPRFSRWIRSEVLRLAHTSSFNLRKLTAKAQRDNDEALRAALFLHAYENGQLQRLISYVYDPDVADEYRSIAQHLGQRSLERLALRGTPMMSLPLVYREFLASFEASYHTPERVSAEKDSLRDDIVQAMLRTGTTPSEIAHALNLDASNLNGYLSRGESGRLTLESVRAILDYVTTE